MSGDSPELPASGLAEEVIPLLRAKLALSALPAAAKPGEPSAPRSSILAFADTTHARGAGDAAPPARVLQVVLFRLDRERYAVPIASVHEILRVTPITRVPEAPRHVRGVMNVRGRLLPVVELRTILGLPPLVVDGESRVIKASLHGRVLGLLVDRVSYVLSFPESALEGAPGERGERAECVTGVLLEGDAIVLLLDLERTLSLPG
jgi:purine-binding chemotaxis protein CheW